MKNEDYIKLGKIMRMCYLAEKKFSPDYRYFHDFGYGTHKGRNAYYLTIAVEGADSDYTDGYYYAVVVHDALSVNELWDKALPQLLELFKSRHG